MGSIITNKIYKI